MRNPLTFILFLIVIIAVYSLLNYYFIRKQRNILTAGSLPLLLLRLFLVTVIFTPVATFIFSYKELPVPAAVFGFTGYSWLAFLFIFLIIHGVIDIALFIAERAGYDPPEHLARRVLIVTLTVSIGMLMYGYFESDVLTTERVLIETTKLPPDIEQVKIMQVSDIHFSPLISVSRARQIRDIAEKEKPDIIISTGDFLDRAIRDSDDVAAVMKSIRAPHGKFAVTGNHEFISGVDESIAFIEKSGFTMIRDAVVTVRSINLAGLDDISAERFGMVRERTERQVLEKADRSLYTILLKHQPKVVKDNFGLFDLQLSGHTHGGQIFPFTFIVKLIYPYLCGMYELGGGSRLYVSRGTGNWGPPVRILSPPEVTIFEIRRKRGL